MELSVRFCHFAISVASESWSELNGLFCSNFSPFLLRTKTAYIWKLFFDHPYTKKRRRISQHSLWFPFRRKSCKKPFEWQITFCDSLKTRYQLEACLIVSEIWLSSQIDFLMFYISLHCSLKQFLNDKSVEFFYFCINKFSHITARY